jgi:AraC family transcriptional activator of pobA
MNNGFQAGYTPPDLILVRKLEALIEVYFKEHKNVSFCCDRLNVSIKVMNSHMKFHRRRTVVEAICLRINQEALTFLKESNETIKYASYELGFNAPSDFTKTFKLLNGTTPRKFRQLHRKNTTR